MSDFSQWYNHTYPYLSGCGVWLRGGELNTLAPGEYERRPFHVLFARLSTYRDTADSFTHKLLYQIAAETDGVYPDLAYLPPPRDVELFVKDRIPWLLGTTTKRGPGDFDLIGLSNSVLLEILNLPGMLTRSGIPLRKSERIEAAGVPLIILGGANALHTSALFCPDPLVDAIFVGEDAECIREILAVCRSGKAEGIDKRGILSRLCAIDGVFEPDRIGSVKRRVAAKFSSSQAMTRGPVLYEEDQIGVGNLQISEGCPSFCGFCAESWARKPYRESSRAELRKSALEMKRAMGVDDCEIYSFNFNMHRQFYEVLGDAVDLFGTVGLKSQRFDMIADDPELMRMLHAAGKSTITCGLEGISGRLRRYLHKSLDDTKTRRALDTILRSPIRELKIFLLATGREEVEDYAEFKDLLRFMSHALEAAGRRPRIVLSMTPLVRFSWTPQEFEDAPDAAQMREVLAQTERVVKAEGFEFRSAADVNEYRVSQILARADDPRICTALSHLFETSGFVYYDAIPRGIVETFERILREVGVDATTLLRAVPPGTPRSWDRIDPGVSREFMISQWESARQCIDTAFCLGSAAKKGVCLGCGACPDAATKTAIRAPRVPASQAALLKRLGAKRDCCPVNIAVTVGEKARGIPSKMRAVALARALMLADPALTEGYRGCVVSQLERGFGSSWLVGDDVLTTTWDRSFAQRVEALLLRRELVDAVNRHLDGWAAVRALAPSLDLDVEIRLTSPYPFVPSKFLTSKNQTYTSRRLGEGEYRFDFSKDALKRKYLRSLISTAKGAHHVVVLTPDVNFRLEEFVKCTFKLPSPDDWVRVRAVALTVPAAQL